MDPCWRSLFNKLNYLVSCHRLIKSSSQSLIPANSSLMVLLGCLWHVKPPFSAPKKAGTNCAFRETMAPTSIRVSSALMVLPPTVTSKMQFLFPVKRGSPADISFCPYTWYSYDLSSRASSVPCYPQKKTQKRPKQQLRPLQTFPATSGSPTGWAWCFEARFGFSGGLARKGSLGQG